MVVLDEIRKLLGDTLQLGARADQLAPGTLLLANMPELDSMAVANVIMAIEERFGIVIDDDEVSGETFESVGSLCRFVEQKIAA